MSSLDQRAAPPRAADQSPSQARAVIRQAADLPLNPELGSVKSCFLTLEDVPFDPLWFAQEHIAMPPSIARSVPKRQAEFFFGRWAAREALMQCGVTGFDVGIGASREPVWPPGVVGSLTHCHGYAAAAVAPARELQGIGIDIEQVAHPQSLEALLAVALDATEMDRLVSSTQGLSTAQLATLAFSAKESFYKAAFPQVGRFFGFEAARVVEVRERPRVLRLELTESLAGEWRAGCAIDVSFQWLANDVVFTSFCA
jgi:enterobactin synthetase component D